MPPIVVGIVVEDHGTPALRQFSAETHRTINALERQAQSLRAMNAPRDAYGRFVKTGQDVAQSFTQSSQKSDTFASSLGRIVGGLSVATAAFAGFHAASAFVRGTTESIIGFDAAMANVNTVLTGSNVSIKQLEQQIVQLPPAFGTSTELAKGLYQALSAGIEPAKAVGFVGEQAKLAKAGLTDLDTTVKVSTAAMDAFGISAENVSHVSDVLFEVVRIGKAEFAPLAASIANVFPLARNLGISFEETAATVTTLTKVFPSVSEAVTGFRSFLSNVTAHMDDFRAAGINVQEVIGTRGVTGLIEELARVTGQSAEVLRAKFIPDVEGGTVALALMGPQLQTQKENVAAFGQTAGSNAVAFVKQQASVQAALERIGAAFDRVIQGGGLAPLFHAMLQPVELWVTSLAQGGEASVRFATIVTQSLSAIVTGIGLLAQGTVAVVEGWYRLGQGIGTVATLFFDGLEGMTQAARSLGLISQETADAALLSLAKASLPFRQFTIDMGAAADEWGTARASIAAGQAAIEASLAQAGQQAQAFTASLHGLGTAGTQAGQQIAQAGVAVLNTIDAAQAKTAEAIRHSAEVADAANAVVTQSSAEARAAITTAAVAETVAVLNSTQAAVSGTVTFWRDGQLQIREALASTGTTGTATAGQIGEAFSKAGISTSETLQRNATDALTSFKTILDAGTATPQALLAEWQKKLKEINDAGFQTLPPGFQEIQSKMLEIARQAGVELPTIYRDAFGQVRTEGQKILVDEFSTIFDKVTEQIVKYGANVREHLDPATLKAAENFGLLGRRASEAATQVGEGLGGAFETAAAQADTASTGIFGILDEIGGKADETAKKVNAVFVKPFSDTLIGLRAELKETQQELSRVAQLSEIDAPGLQKFTRTRLQEELEILRRKIAEAEQRDEQLFGTKEPPAAARPAPPTRPPTREVTKPALTPTLPGAELVSGPSTAPTSFGVRPTAPTTPSLPSLQEVQSAIRKRQADARAYETEVYGSVAAKGAAVGEAPIPLFTQEIQSLKALANVVANRQPLSSPAPPLLTAPPGGVRPLVAPPLAPAPQPLRTTAPGLGVSSTPAAPGTTVPGQPGQQSQGVTVNLSIDARALLPDRDQGDRIVAQLGPALQQAFNRRQLRAS